NPAKCFASVCGCGGLTPRGSEQNSGFGCWDGRVTTLTNTRGGIQGGISNGRDIYFRVAFKPVATILRTQQTVSAGGERVEFKAAGRHDPCVLPRAVPIVEAMAAMVIADNLLVGSATGRR
ncbi:MAG: chorismate synthase, partial [Prevotella sp.]|nr:chorismate synthase [Prevotella sp.]